MKKSFARLWIEVLEDRRTPVAELEMTSVTTTFASVAVPGDTARVTVVVANTGAEPLRRWPDIRLALRRRHPIRRRPLPVNRSPECQNRHINASELV